MKTFALRSACLALVCLALAAARHAAPVHYVVAPTGNEARYRVREQLVGHDLPNDAIGKTSSVTGGIMLADDGSIVADSSKFTIDVTGLKSDRQYRDGYVQHRLLETSQYPNVVLAATAVKGLPSPLPTSGSVTFDLTGDLTVHGTTHPTDWHVTAQVNGDTLAGNAWTTFTFADFALTQPKVPVLLSVADTIRLEYDFRLVKAP